MLRSMPTADKRKMFFSDYLVCGFAIPRLLLSMVGLILAVGCLAKQTVEYQELQRAVDQDRPPRILAVLPFKNHTDNEGLGELVRSSFYSHFSVRPYQDVELYTVDQRLRYQIIPGTKKFTKSYLQELGRLLQCDAVISGEVIDSKRIFVGVYSQLNLEVAIAVWDTRQGIRVWKDRHTERKHEGGVPFSLEEIPLITVRSGLNLRESVRIEIIDKLCRHLAGRVPAPSYAAALRQQGPSWEFELQVGAFLNPKLASGLLGRLRDSGYPAYSRRYQDQRGLWYRVLLGPYEDPTEAAHIQNELDEKFGTDSFVAKVPAIQP